MLKPSELSRLATTMGGLPILGCLEGSPAEEAGMRYGDILLSINGIPTGSWDDFLKARARSGDEIRARVFREGAELDLEFTLRASRATPLEVLEELQARGILPSADDTREDGGLDH